MKTLWIIILYIFVLLVWTVIWFFCAPTLAHDVITWYGKVDWNDSVGKVYNDISYWSGELNKFDLYVPAKKWKNSNKLIVYIHQGGYVGWDKSEDKNLLQNYASRWYIAAWVNYTVRNESHPNATVREMSEEIKQSIPVIIAEAEKLGYKLDMMAVAGASAWGNLAMIFAYRDAESSPIPIKLVFQFVWPVSLDPVDWLWGDGSYKSDEEAKKAIDFLKLFSPDEITVEMMRNGTYKEKIKNISPHELITEKSPPTLAAYGLEDKVVPYNTSEPYLFPALEKNKVTFEYVLFPKSGHALNRDKEQSDIMWKKLTEYLEKYLN